MKSFLNIEHIRVAGIETEEAGTKLIHRVGVACGSAGQFITQARQAHCDLLITGETSFHTCLEAEATGIGLILLGHYASERFAMESLAERLAANEADLIVWASRTESDPLRLV